MISITPPRGQEAWWQIWKALDGRIMVDTLTLPDESGDFGTECSDYGRMAEALVVIRKELLD